MKIKTVWQQRGDLVEKKKQENNTSVINLASTTETSTQQK